MRLSSRARMLAVIASVVAVYAAEAAPASATIRSVEVTVSPGSYWSDSVYHNYYWVEACPIANYDVAGGAAGHYFAYAIGNASNNFEPCIFVASDGTSETMWAYNYDQSNSRTFWMYGDY